MLLVSVIVPVYNHEKFAVECLNSVRDSDYKQIELIIIDDGSTDNSSAIVEAWLEANSHYFVRTFFQRQANVGVCRTANRLISLSQGDIIVPLASDDVLLPAGISQRVAHLQAHPDLLAVFADAAMIDANGAIICREFEKNVKKGDKNILADPRFIARELILKWSVPGPVFAAWRKAFDPAVGVGLYDETLLIEDRDLYLKLLSRRALGYIPDEVALYRYIPQGLSKGQERGVAVRRGRLICEQLAINHFRGLEKFYLTLVSFRNKADLLCYSDSASVSKRWWFKLMDVAVELTYRWHKVVFYCVRLMNSLFNQSVVRSGARVDRGN